MVLVYHTTIHFPKIIESFKDLIFGFGEYGNIISRSLLEPQGILSQIISTINRILIPLTWIIIIAGSFILFIKKKLYFERMILGLTGGFYLIVGFFYSILGTRSLQILCIPLITGVEYFYNTRKKPLIILIAVLILCSIFSPMRSAYDNYFFQVDEEKEGCNFLANNIPSQQSNHIALGQISGDYFVKKNIYLNKDNEKYIYPTVVRPRNYEFYEIFNEKMNINEYLLFNTNLGRQMYVNGIKQEELNSLIQVSLLNNKIYESGSSYVLTGE
jgi:hypothetical protein